LPTGLRFAAAIEPDPATGRWATSGDRVGKGHCPPRLRARRAMDLGRAKASARRSTAGGSPHLWKAPGGCAGFGWQRRPGPSAFPGQRLTPAPERAPEPTSEEDTREYSAG